MRQRKERAVGVLCMTLNLTVAIVFASVPYSSDDVVIGAKPIHYFEYEPAF